MMQGPPVQLHAPSLILPPAASEIIILTLILSLLGQASMEVSNPETEVYYSDDHVKSTLKHWRFQALEP